MVFNDKLMGLMIDMEVGFINNDLIAKELGHFFERNALGLGYVQAHEDRPKS
jgi:hypothetical protein